MITVRPAGVTVQLVEAAPASLLRARQPRTPSRPSSQSGTRVQHPAGQRDIEAVTGEVVDHWALLPAWPDELGTLVAGEPLGSAGLDVGLMHPVGQA